MFALAVVFACSGEGGSSSPTNGSRSGGRDGGSSGVNGACTGTAVAPGDMTDLFSCQRQLGDWQVQREFCADRPVSCPSQMSRELCLDLLGCVWTSTASEVTDTTVGACDGVAPGCEQLSGADCQTDVRCEPLNQDGCQNRRSTAADPVLDCRAIGARFAARQMHHEIARGRCLETFGCRWVDGSVTFALDGRRPNVELIDTITLFASTPMQVRATIAAAESNGPSCPPAPTEADLSFFSPQDCIDDGSGGCLPPEQIPVPWAQFGNRDDAYLRQNVGEITDACTTVRNGGGCDPQAPLESDSPLPLYQTFSAACADFCVERGGWGAAFEVGPNGEVAVFSDRWTFVDRLIRGGDVCTYEGMLVPAP